MLKLTEMNDADASVATVDDVGSENDGTIRYVCYTGQENVQTDVTHVGIDPSIKVIEEGTFQNCQQLVEVEICAGLERIEKYAFEHCKSLHQIKIPSTVKVIAEGAFGHCDQLKVVELCNGLEEMGAKAFESCSMLQHITIPSTVKKIGSGAFSACENLVEVDIPQGLEKIENSVFKECASLLRVSIPLSVREIDYFAFASCSELKQVELCDGLERIGSSAFILCELLGRISIPSSVKWIGNKAFKGCRLLEEVELRQGLLTIDSEAFAFCRKLQAIKIPSTIKQLRDKAFFSCQGMLKVEFSEGVLSQLDRHSFASCVSLQRIKLPSSVETIRKHAFHGCSQLAAEVGLCCGLRRIEYRAFYGCISLQHIKIPSTVNKIDERAFEYCTQLISMELYYFWGLDYAVFLNCFSLRNIVIPRSGDEWDTPVGLTGCYDLMQAFGSKQEAIEDLRERFRHLTVHYSCYYQSYTTVEWIIARESETVPTSNYKIQDCLGMTPLHILACSSKHDLRLYQWVVATHPKSIITEDKWGYLPIFYAVWVNAREEILHYLVACLETHAISLKWNSMVETMCGAGASVERVQTLLNIHRTSFPEDSIDWQKVARALTMSCVLRIVTLGSPGNGQTINILWDSMMVCIRSSHSQDGELIQHLEKIQEVLFPIPIDTTWNLFYEKFARYFWNNYHVPFEMFRFLAKCNIFDRVEQLRVGKMQSEMHSMLTIIQDDDDDDDDDDDSQEDWYDKIYSTLISYEQINDSLYLLELAAWMYRIISSQQDGINNDCDDVNCVKWMYRVDCGANVIIDNVLSFLIGD